MEVLWLWWCKEAKVKAESSGCSEYVTAVGFHVRGGGVVNVCKGKNQKFTCTSEKDKKLFSSLSNTTSE